MTHFKSVLLGSAITGVMLTSTAPSFAQTVVNNTNTKAEEVDKKPKNALDEIVVTGTRQERKILDVPANISVVSDVELERRIDFTLEDTLRYEPGIVVPRQTSGTDPFSSSGGVRIRGVGGNRTQVIVDGTRTMESITDGTRDVVDASNMKTVEIQRGPASVLWGSDGLGGVIAFVTKDPEDYMKDGAQYGGAANISFSSLDNTFKESVAGAYQLSDNVSAMAVYTRRDSSEIELRNARMGADALQDCPRDAVATPCNEFDPLDVASNNLLAKLVWKVSDNNQIRLSGEYFDRTSDVLQNSTLGAEIGFFGGPTGNSITSYERTQEITRWRLSLDQEWSPDGMFFDDLKWKATYSPQDSNRNGDRRRTLANGDLEQRIDDQEYGETFAEFDLQLTSNYDAGGTKHVLTYGFDGDQTKTDYNRVDTTRNLTQGTESIRRAGGFNFADATTLRADAYLQDEISILDDRLKLIPGIRVAYYEIDPTTDADFQIVPGAEPRKIDNTDVQLKLGTIFNIDDTVSLYGQFSQGFKMPTAQQLYQSLDSLPFFALVPNPNLKPESVDNYEVGVRGNFGSRGFFSVNLFQAKYVDFIQNFVSADATDYGLPAGSFVLTYDNVDGLNMHGIEASAGVKLSDQFSTRLSASWQEGTTIDDDVREDYIGALPFKAIAGLRYENEGLGLDLDLTAIYQAGGMDLPDPTRIFSPDSYLTFDVLASWEIMPNVKLQANVFNLTDKRYFDASTIGFAINRSDTVKKTNPIELNTAPGRNFKIGLAYTF